MTESGRHRRGRRAWVLPLAVVAALAAGFGLGVAVQGNDDTEAASRAAQSSAAASATEATLSSQAAASTAAPPTASGATATAPVPAPPDPSNAEAGPVAPFLAALDRAGVPIGANRDVVVAIGRQVCQQPPQRRADVAGLGMTIASVFPGLWNPEQGAAIVTAADQTLC